MNINKVKYWKVVKSDLKLHDALNMLKGQAIQGTLYKNLAIRLGDKIIFPNTNANELLFSIKEMESNYWEAIIPDDGMEELLYKTRELVKNEHFLPNSHASIDNMSMNDIFHAIHCRLNTLDERTKYRIIKHIIENKLYKSI